RRRRPPRRHGPERGARRGGPVARRSRHVRGDGTRAEPIRRRGCSETHRGRARRESRAAADGMNARWAKRDGARVGLVRWIPVAVTAAIALAVAAPSLVGSRRAPLEPLQLNPVAAPAAPIPRGSTWPAEASPAKSTLVLYDRSGRWGWLGELYATMT